MRINETQEGQIRLTGSVLKGMETSIRFTEEHVASMGMDDEKESEQEQELSPIPYLNPLEAKVWDHLSPKEKERYMNLGRRVPPQEKMREMAGENRNSKDDRNRSWSDPQTGRHTTAGETGRQNGVRSVKEGTLENKNIAVETAKTGTDTAEEAASGALSAGAGMLMSAGKKTAEKFRESLTARSQVSQQTLERVEQDFRNIRAENQTMETPKEVVVYVGASLLIGLVGMLQMAASMVLTVMSVIVSVIVSVISAVLIIGVVVSVILSFLDNQTSGAERIVEVALTQEGTTDGSLYWEYVMGSDFVNGSSTPWCASFVTWCANQCGFIDAGIFPKTGSVQTYQTHYQSLGLFEAAGDYIPKQGDLVIFQPSHIGIVQYVENNIVVTIEGNTTDSVASRAYSLDNSRIVGYCKPLYPYEASFEGNSNEEITYNFLRSQGCTPETAAAILGNLKQESGVDPTCYQTGGPGRGICQWEEGSDRFEKLCARAQASGKSWMDLQVQLEFLWYELSGGESTCRYIMNRDYGGFENFMHATDIEWAVEAFERSFERAGRPMMQNRITYAYEYYEQFANGRRSR